MNDSSDSTIFFWLSMVVMMLSTGVLTVPDWLKRRRNARVEASRPPKPVCDGCEHHYSFHDHIKHTCNQAVPRARYNKKNERLPDALDACPCNTYVGPIPDAAAHLARLLELELPHTLNGPDQIRATEKE